MKALKLSALSPSARSIAVCLMGSPINRKHWWFSNISLVEGMFVIEFDMIQTTNGGIVYYKRDIVDEIIIPLDTLVFDPFVAMREGVWAKGFAPTVSGGHDVRGFIESFESNEWGVAICKGSTQLSMVNENITLDIEAACRLDGVEVVDL